MAIENQQLSMREKLGYSVGDTASNLYFQVFMLFISYFYTDVFGLSSRAAATMFLVARIWDAINDPVMGYIADRTKTRYGKFRPFVIFAAVPLGVLGVVTFITPELQDTGKLVYAYVTYILLTMAYTAVNVPYASLMSVMTPSADERTVLSTYRFIAVFAAQFIVQYAVLTLVPLFGKGVEADGWPWAMGCLSVLAVILLAITFFSTKERVASHTPNRTPFRRDLKTLFLLNRPWVLIGVATIFQLVFIAMRSGNIMYYFKYVVGSQSVSLFDTVYQFTTAELTTRFFLTGTMMTMISAALTVKFVSIFDKAKIYAVFLGIAGLATTVYLFLAPNNLILIFTANLIVSFAIGPVSVLQWAIYTDTDDYSDWKNGYRTTGLLMAASLFALKIGGAIGGALLVFGLDLHGFVPNAVQGNGSITGIKLMMSIYPALFALAGMLVMWFYPLTNSKLKDIESALQERRTAQTPDIRS